MAPLNSKWSLKSKHTVRCKTYIPGPVGSTEFPACAYDESESQNIDLAEYGKKGTLQVMSNKVGWIYS